MELTIVILTRTICLNGSDQQPPILLLIILLNFLLKLYLKKKCFVCLLSLKLIRISGWVCSLLTILTSAVS